MLVIAAALSRAGPARPAARARSRRPTRRTRKFDDEKSEFLGDLKLWKWLEAARGGHGEHRLSNRKHEQLLRENFVSPRRVREWRDIHAQLHTVVAEHGWRAERARRPTYEQLHLSLLAGLLGNIGLKSDEDDVVPRRARHQFYRHPGAHLAKKPGRWIVAAELVETTRLFGARHRRDRAALAASRSPATCSRSSCSSRTGRRRPREVVALERATLYGLVVYSNRRVQLRPRRPGGGARDLHPRGAGRRRVGDARCRSSRTTAS